MAFQFYALNQTPRAYSSICLDYSNNLYVGTDNAGIFIRPSGESTLEELLISGSPYPGGIFGIIAVPSGDIYRVRNGYKIAKRTGGVGDFVEYDVNYDYFSLLSLAYSAQTGYVYFTHFNGPGISRFDPTHAADHAHAEAVWYSGNQTFGACISKAGDLYICCHTSNGPGASSSGYIYCQRGETGSWEVYTNSFPEYTDPINGNGYRSWSAIGAAKNGDVYAATVDRIFRQAYGESLFYVFQELPGISALHGAHDGSVYATRSGVDIYKLNSPSSKLKEYAQIIG